MNGQGDLVNIICTQPRRVAATSVAERVAEEMTDRYVILFLILLLLLLFFACTLLSTI